MVVAATHIDLDQLVATKFLLPVAAENTSAVERFAREARASAKLRSKDGKFLWPGFGENMRVLKWVVDRARLRVGGQETVFGWVPKAGDLDLSGLDISHEKVDEATHIDLDEWEKEVSSYGEFFDTLGDAMPQALKLHRDLLLARIEAVKGGHG